MPRTCPSMRLMRLVSAEWSPRPTRGCRGRAGADVPARFDGLPASLRDEVISGTFDRELQRSEIGARGVERHFGAAAIEHDRRFFHAGYGLQHASHAGDASAARHALHFEVDGFHVRSCGSNQVLGRQRFSSNALPTTETELAAMAAPAMTGLSSPAAASGMPSTLYA